MDAEEPRHPGIPEQEMDGAGMMCEREKVIGHLYDCLSASRPENLWVFVRKDIVGDALSLLKDLEPVEPTFKQGEDGVFVWACGSCGAYMYHIYDGIDKAKEYAKYCRQCGKKVKWNDA